MSAGNDDNTIDSIRAPLTEKTLFSKKIALTLKELPCGLAS